jgi:ATP-dependent protease HslVU (ClpYQ) peptidase subunit
MTTIAARFSTLEIAADSQVSGEDIKYNVEKLRRGVKSIYGGAGDWDKLLAAFQALEEGKTELDDDCDVELIELRHDGIWVYESTLIPAKIKNDFYAIGTGAAYAIAAMHLGKSPKEAVELASLYDPGTGGPIDCWTLGPCSVDLEPMKKAARKGSKRLLK